MFRNDSPISSPPRILVGICSCVKYADKRQAVRETWLSGNPPEITCRFFIGRTADQLMDEPDTDVLDADDSYEFLPEKVLAFFRHALLNHEFDWLFKCDDDTYVSLDRLPGLVRPESDLVGSTCVASRGAPSGGAGYLLSRRMVEMLVNDDSLPPIGAEDLLIGQAAFRLGGRCHPDDRLGLTQLPFPRRDNTLITAHWCQPDRLRAIHTLLHREPTGEAILNHRHWRDTVNFYPGGFFVRRSSGCSGRWEADAFGNLTLRWFDWPEEYFRANPPVQKTDGLATSYDLTERKLESITIQLMGGLGNQMFQYAHGLALARKLGTKLKLNWAPNRRPFALGVFGLGCEPLPDPCEHFTDEGTWHEGEWPSFQAAVQASAPHLVVFGYFQNEEFFKPVAEEIRGRFRIEPVLGVDVDGSTPVCVHVRRGDFIDSGLHDVCTPDYYLSGIRMIRATVEKPVFLVVSDDPDWCADVFAGIADVVVLPPQPQMRTLQTMMECKAFVISNSTFSWWGAWLSNAPVVIAPSRFLKGFEWNVCPDRWIQIPPEGIPAEVDPPVSTHGPVVGGHNSNDGGAVRIGKGGPVTEPEPAGMTQSYMAIVTFGRSGSTMLQYALNQTPGVVVRGENHNLAYGLHLAYSAAVRASQRSVPGRFLDDPWYGAGDIPLESLTAGQRELFVDCVLRPKADTVMCGWKEVRYTPWSVHFPEEEKAMSPANFGQLFGYLVFLDRLLPGIRFLINTRNPTSASKSSWWKKDSEEAEEILSTAYDWLNALPEALETQLGRKAAMLVKYEDWSEEPSCLESVWRFLGIPWDGKRTIDLFNTRVNK